MKTITSTRRTGVNQLVLVLNDGTTRLLTSPKEIGVVVERNLPQASRRYGLKGACSGIGRISIPKQ